MGLVSNGGVIYACGIHIDVKRAWTVLLDRPGGRVFIKGLGGRGGLGIAKYRKPRSCLRLGGYPNKRYSLARGNTSGMRQLIIDHDGNRSESIDVAR